jgi:hypothetical protein
MTIFQAQLRHARVGEHPEKEFREDLEQSLFLTFDLCLLIFDFRLRKKALSQTIRLSVV